MRNKTASVSLATPSLLLLLLLCGASTVPPAAAQPDPPPLNIEWYISSTNGSDNVTTCGRTAAAPCSSLLTIIALSDSFEREQTTCYLAANGSADGRASTTIYFMEGVHFVPALCLSRWENLTIVGLDGARIVSRLGAARGFFEFEDCHNIEIRDLEFGTAFVGKATLYFTGSSELTLSGLTVNTMADHSFGIMLEQNFGTISLTDITIFGNPAATGYQNNVLGLQITQGCLDSGSTFANRDTCAARSMDLTVTNCTVRDIASGGDPEDSYSATHNSAIGVVVRFLFNASGNRVTFRNSTFTRIYNTRTSGVLVNFDRLSTDNTVQFSQCCFQDNVVRYGGGFATYFYSQPPNSRLLVEDCDFTSNTATLEGGGLFLASLSQDVTSTVTISRSNFYGNQAIFGGAVYLFNNPAWFSVISTQDAKSVLLPLVAANITDCTFERNNGSLDKGVVHALRMQLGVLGDNSFTDNTGSALVLHSSLAYFEGNVSFVRNVADQGGALKIVDGSRVDMSGVEQANFTANKATFTGGAIYADDASTTLLAGEYNHSVAGSRFRSCFLSFGDELRQRPVQDRIVFRDNTAVAEGDTIHAFSLRGCVIGNFVPFQTSLFLTIMNTGIVSYDDVSTLESTATGASYLFFYGASSRCYKPVGDVTFLLPNCSHAILTETFALQSDLQCSLRAMLGELNRIFTIGTGLRPPVDKLLLPWVGVEADWTIQPSGASNREDCPQPVPGELYLAPAPGEQFDLTVQLADQFLNIISDTIYLEVDHEVDQPTGVLMQLNGIQYAFNDRVYFTPNRALSGLALVGLPGTEGRLRVVSRSQIRGDTIALFLPFKLAQCPLGYYYSPTIQTIDQVNRLLQDEFSRTQRLPLNQPLACQCFSSAGSPVTFPSRVTAITHTCVAGHTVQLNSILWAGFQPALAASDDGVSSFQPSEVPCPLVPENATAIEDNLSVFVSLSRQRSSQGSNGTVTFNPVDVVPYEGGVTPGGGAPVICYGNNTVQELVAYEPEGQFLIEFCTRGYCLGDSRSSWNVGDVGFPCVEHRQGTLCGQCEPGFAVTLYTSICQDCSSSGKRYQPYLALFLTLLLGMLLVLFVVRFNLGVSPILDSFLFFIQAVMIILAGRADYQLFQYLAIFNPDFTFNLCIVPNLNGLIRLVLQYVTPIYILLLLCTVLLLTYVKGLSKYLGRHNFLQALWLLFLISYLNIANTTFEIIHCRTIGPEEGGERMPVLVHDASIQCFEGTHLPFGIIAIALGLFFVVPFPLYSIIFMFIPKLKPITDVYTSHYKPCCRYWVFWSLLRRLLLVALGVFIQDFIYRHLTLLLVTILILAVFIFSWPYKSKVENTFGAFISLSLLLVTFVTIPELDRITDPLRAISSLITVVTLLVGIVLVVLEAILKYRGTTTGRVWKQKVNPWITRKKTSLSRKVEKKQQFEERELEVSTVVSPVNTIDATAFREPLLDSVFTGSVQTTSLNSSSIEQARRKAKTTLAKHKSASSSSPEKMMSKSDEMDMEGHRIGVTVVGPPGHTDSSRSDTGFATARTYTDGEQFIECYRNMDAVDGTQLATSITSTIDATAFREPVLDSVILNSSASNANSQKLEQTREKARETLNKHKVRNSLAPPAEEGEEEEAKL